MHRLGLVGTGTHYASLQLLVIALLALMPLVGSIQPAAAVQDDGCPDGQHVDEATGGCVDDRPILEPVATEPLVVQPEPTLIPIRPTPTPVPVRPTLEPTSPPAPTREPPPPPTQPPAPTRDPLPTATTPPLPTEAPTDESLPVEPTEAAPQPAERVSVQFIAHFCPDAVAPDQPDEEWLGLCSAPQPGVTFEVLVNGNPTGSTETGPDGQALLNDIPAGDVLVTFRLPDGLVAADPILTVYPAGLDGDALPDVIDTGANGQWGWKTDPGSVSKVDVPVYSVPGGNDAKLTLRHFRCLDTPNPTGFSSPEVEKACDAVFGGETTDFVVVSSQGYDYQTANVVVKAGQAQWATFEQVPYEVVTVTREFLPEFRDSRVWCELRSQVNGATVNTHLGELPVDNTGTMQLSTTLAEPNSNAWFTCIWFSYPGEPIPFPTTELTPISEPGASEVPALAPTGEPQLVEQTQATPPESNDPGPNPPPGAPLGIVFYYHYVCANTLAPALDSRMELIAACDHAPNVTTNFTLSYTVGVTTHVVSPTEVEPSGFLGEHGAFRDVPLVPVVLARGAVPAGHDESVVWCDMFNSKVDNGEGLSYGKIPVNPDNTATIPDTVVNPTPPTIRQCAWFSYPSANIALGPASTPGSLGSATVPALAPVVTPEYTPPALIPNEPPFLLPCDPERLQSGSEAICPVNLPGGLEDLAPCNLETGDESSMQACIPELDLPDVAVSGSSSISMISRACSQQISDVQTIQEADAACEIRVNAPVIHTWLTLETGSESRSGFPEGPYQLGTMVMWDEVQNGAFSITRDDVEYNGDSVVFCSWVAQFKQDGKLMYSVAYDMKMPMNGDDSMSGNIQYPGTDMLCVWYNIPGPERADLSQDDPVPVLAPTGESNPSLQPVDDAHPPDPIVPGDDDAHPPDPIEPNPAGG